MPGRGTPGPFRDLLTKGKPLIDQTSLFSAPDGQPRCTTAASPPPATNPFKAPDFGEDETFPLEDVQDPA
ncbi:hypothetical protein OG539_17115 [Actinacidiphila glaucinigra]|uniref:hypothetical protein n=1 Tax=Actinacidiphila glaucinigra TaxID=235986 RepID=UPI002DD9E1AD|nr:hypothetical protein [Actinacidiphila glaucinigra]WSD62039.1 hypothetical protein OIE69_25670 [Actinacidiphila glaucinigra]